MSKLGKRGKDKNVLAYLVKTSRHLRRARSVRIRMFSAQHFQNRSKDFGQKVTFTGFFKFRFLHWKMCQSHSNQVIGQTLPMGRCPNRFKPIQKGRLSNTRSWILLHDEAERINARTKSEKLINNLTKYFDWFTTSKKIKGQARTCFDQSIVSCLGS